MGRKRYMFDELGSLEKLMRLAANDKTGTKFVAVNFSRAAALRYAKAIKNIRGKLIDIAITRTTGRNG